MDRRPLRLVVALLLTSSGAARPALADGPVAVPAPARAPPVAAAAPSIPVPPAAIAPPLIAGRAEDALATLDRLDASFGEDPVLDRVAQELPIEERTVGLIRSAAITGTGGIGADRDLADVEREIARAGGRLTTVQEALDGRAQRLQDELTELQRLEAVWRATAVAPATSDAPERVRERVSAVNQRIADVHARSGSYLARLAELQDTLARTRRQLNATAAEVERTRRTLERQLFEIESAPLWRALTTPPPSGVEAGRTRAMARTHLRALGRYLASGDADTWQQLAFFLLSVLILESLHRARRGAAPSQLEAAVLRHSVLAAAIATLVTTPLFQPRAPPPLLDAAAVLAVIPWALVSRDVVPRRLLAPQLVLTLLFAVDRLITFAPPHAVWARLVLLACSGGGVALAAAGLRKWGWGAALPEGGWRTATRAALWMALALLAVAVVTNVAGNVTLAIRLDRGTLTSALAGVLAAGLVLVARATISATLQLEPVRRRRIVALHGARVEQRLRQVVRWACVALWLWFAAASFGVTGLAKATVVRVLERPLSIGSLRVSLGDLVAFGVTLWIAVVLSRLVRFVLDEGVLPAMPLGRGVPGAISKTAQYVLVGLGAVAALYAAGIELGKFSLFAGTLGVGIGFGLQNVVNNFVSGLILLYERPVQPGDVVEVGSIQGEVRRIGVRSSTVRTFQGADVIVPNATFISAEVVNWTFTDRTRRAEVKVGVAYGTDPALVRQVLLEAVRRDDVLRDPKPMVLFTDFGDSALQFELRFWPAHFDSWVVVASEVRETILRELGRAGVVIPFPQRDVHVRHNAPAEEDAT